mmetsp:Transcript_17352/g.36250  ORF Transcript_17352/g.36250 Transcript_17352/m.36250 type:complete len:208 (-) Transcript_17352:564-1187(-)
MPRSQMSKRSIVSYKLESRLKQEETRQLKLKSKLAEQDKLVAGLKRSLAQQQTSRQPASARRVPESVAEASDSLDNLMKVDTASLAGGPGDEELVTRALDALFNWMRLRNYRTIDLFRRRDVRSANMPFTADNCGSKREGFAGRDNLGTIKSVPRTANPSREKSGPSEGFIGSGRRFLPVWSRNYRLLDSVPALHALTANLCACPHS